MIWTQVAAAVAAAGLVGGLPVTTHTAPTIGLRADVNRDGLLTAADEAGEGSWTDRRGAVVLPNVDDDQRRCPATGPQGEPLPDDTLAACGDGADDVVNGPADLADLAPLRIERTAATTDASLTVDGAAQERTRVFIFRDGDWSTLSGPIGAAELRRGVELRLEARDVVRDRSVWDGGIEVSVRLGTAVDRVRLHVSPLLFQHDLMPVSRVVIADNTSREGASEFRRDLRAGLDRFGMPQPWLEFRSDGDVWVQDMFQPAYVSMPADGGREQRMTIYLRIANTTDPAAPDYDPRFPLRAGSRAVFTQLRGPNVGAIQQYDAARAADPAQFVNGTFSSGGNFEAIPPYPGFSTGRILYGAGPQPFVPDSTFTRMLDAQGYQRPVVVDTSFLGVGHVDEVVSFLPAPNNRGWVAAVADPRAGWRMLQELEAAGLGGEKMVQGVPPEIIAQDPDPNPDLTVQGALAKASLISGTEIAAAGTDAILRVLRSEVGLTDADIVRIPALFNEIQVPGYPRQHVTYSYLPDTLNGLLVGSEGFLAPRVHGPRRDGHDVYERATERALAGLNLQVGWVEDYAYAHTGIGEIHCVTNVERDLSGTEPWWTERAG